MPTLSGRRVELTEQSILSDRGTPMVAVGKKAFNVCQNVWVAHIDTLGFLPAVRMAGGKAPDFMAALFHLPDLIMAFQAAGLGQPGKADFWANRYADTTIIVGLDQSDDGLAPVAQLTGRLLAWAAGTGFPARAGIARGEAWIGDGEFSVASGPAVGDAYVAEAEQNWAGGAVHPSSITDDLAQACNAFVPNLLVRTAVQIKRDSKEERQERWAVNWAQFLTGPQIGVRKRITYRLPQSRTIDNVKRDRAADFWDAMVKTRPNDAPNEVTIALNGNYLEIPFLAPKVVQPSAP